VRACAYEIAQKVARALAMVRLEGLADAARSNSPAASSSGRRRRALVFEPRLVLLDEPLVRSTAAARADAVRAETLHQRLGVTWSMSRRSDRGHDHVRSGRRFQHRIAASGRRAAPVYEEPDSLFVAQFLGESNALAATVERRDGGQCAATLPGGETIVATAVAPVSWAQGRSRVAAGESGAGRGGASLANRFPARIVEATFLAISCACGWRRWAGRLRAETAQRAGQSALEPGTRSRSAGGRRLPCLVPERRPARRRLLADPAPPGDAGGALPVPLADVL